MHVVEKMLFSESKIPKRRKRKYKNTGEKYEKNFC